MVAGRHHRFPSRQTSVPPPRLAPLPAILRPRPVVDGMRQTLDIVTSIWCRKVGQRSLRRWDRGEPDRSAHHPFGLGSRSRAAAERRSLTRAPQRGDRARPSGRGVRSRGRGSGRPRDDRSAQPVACRRPVSPEDPDARARRRGVGERARVRGGDRGRPPSSMVRAPARGRRDLCGALGHAQPRVGERGPDLGRHVRVRCRGASHHRVGYCASSLGCAARRSVGSLDPRGALGAVGTGASFRFPPGRPSPGLAPSSERTDGNGPLGGSGGHRDGRTSRRGRARIAAGFLDHAHRGGRTSTTSPRSSCSGQRLRARVQRGIAAAKRAPAAAIPATTGKMLGAP